LHHRFEHLYGVIPSTEVPTALLVVMPKTDGAPRLPYTRTEVEAVGKILMPYLNLSKFEGREATKPNIVRALRHCSIAHFACHGKVNATNPIDSRLCLRDHQHAPLTVEVLMAMRIDNCQLVYLSACESAVSKDMRLKEERLHLSGALQMAGVPNTVATWWEISDVVGVTVAREFYNGLVRRDLLDVGMAAEALHAVTLGLDEVPRD
jgi:CHAT domain-containing protein